jgi:cellulose synthase/poly-beta-1,6-N-acetylglucosamine synthase-like glycosyltransferase
MSTSIDILLLVFACMAALPASVFFVECLLGALYRPSAVMDASERARPRLAVLVPAHNEGAGITATLQCLRAQLEPNDMLLVVADNCSDDTAAIAASSGAQVIQRHDAERRGKGYALAFGLDHLAKTPPEVVIIVDADCQVSPGGLERLARLAHDRDRPVQADYLMTPSAQPDGKSVISALAFLVKNRVRPRGLAALGMPCLLTGTGMAFPWQVLRKAPETRDNLVEDMVMGLDLARLGHAPLLCPDASVTSALPDRAQAATAQRRRWEHGHLATLFDHAPSLLKQGIAQGRAELIALALDLMVPPLSLLVISLGAGLVLCAGATLLGASPLPAAVFGASMLAIACGVLAGWYAHGRKLVRARELLAIPLYVIWKLPLYFSFFARGRHHAWERTERKPQQSGDGS